MFWKRQPPARDIPFSQSCRAVLQAAQDMPRRLGQERVRPEHVLLALLKEGAAPRAAAALASAGMLPGQLRQALEAALGPGEEASPGARPWDRGAKAVLARSLDYARRTGRGTTDHLLLAVAEGRSGPAVEALRRHGGTRARLQEAVGGLGQVLEP